MNAPSETTYAIAKFWPMLGGFGMLLALILPKPLAIAWIILVPIFSSIIVIRGAQSLPIDKDWIEDRKENPPRFSKGFYVFAFCLPFVSCALLMVSVKAFAAGFAMLSAIAILFYGVLDYSLKRVVLAPLPSIIISIVLLSQHWGFAGLFTYGIMLVIMFPKSIESSIKNQKLLTEIAKQNIGDSSEDAAVNVSRQQVSS